MRLIAVLLAFLVFGGSSLFAGALVTHVEFDYKGLKFPDSGPETETTDGIHIRVDADNLLEHVDQRWPAEIVVSQCAQISDEPGCYVAGSSGVSLRARLINAGLSITALYATIKTTNGPGPSWPNVSEVATNGEIVDDICEERWSQKYGDEPTGGWVELPYEDIIPSQTGRYDVAITWYVKVGNDTKVKLNTIKTRFYVVLNPPDAPWYQKSPYGKASQFHLWTKALDLGIDKLNLSAHANETDLVTAGASAVNQAYPAAGWKYDRERGRARHVVYLNDEDYFQLSKYISGPDSLCNCHDTSAALRVMAAAFGVATTLTYAPNYGFVKDIQLIGHGLCNNPFDRMTDILNVPPAQHILRSSFHHHQYVLYNGSVLDPMAGVVTLALNESSYNFTYRDTLWNAQNPWGLPTVLPPENTSFFFHDSESKNCYIAR